MRELSQLHITAFQNKILTWYEEHQRDLPWRSLVLDPHTKSRDPYKILLSEIMAQQTQISRVIPKYKAWLDAFPTIQDLAKAPVSEVLKHWSGLGYNRRALNLKKTAQVIVGQYGGKFPTTEKELLSLPGIGQYTARAIMCFAFDQQVSVVDVNVKKVILTQVLKEGGNKKELRLGDANAGQENSKMSDKQIAEIADKLLPHGKAYEWNQALMDYSAMMLKKEKIDIPKQSTFKGSRRYYRGQIVKQLLEKKEINIKHIGALVKKDFTVADKGLMDGILDELQKEGFITIRGELIRIKA